METNVSLQFTTSLGTILYWILELVVEILTAM